MDQQELDYAVMEWENRERAEHARAFADQFDTYWIGKIFNEFEADYMAGTRNTRVLARKYSLRYGLCVHLERLVRKRNGLAPRFQFPARRPAEPEPAIRTAA
ncbi:MAG: hypothetical protein M0Q95_17900 [Porticoccaceae bacterium]|nr:hypothetical protein [Porticoccaceae bacterium]